MRRFGTLTIGLALVGLASSALRAVDPSTEAAVRVVHGIPDLNVDVVVSGPEDITLSKFTFGAMTDPVGLEPGTYAIEVFVLDDGGSRVEPPALEAEATLGAGDNFSVVAHLTEDGAPKLSFFANNFMAEDTGKSRVVIRHAAAAPAVDILLLREVSWRWFRWYSSMLWIRDLANSEQFPQDVNDPVDVEPGDYAALIYPAEGKGWRRRPVAPLQKFALDEGTAYTVYAVGSLAGETFQLLLQTDDLKPTGFPEPETGIVTVVHGIPGATVDVYVNGALTLAGFEPKTITDPLELPEGDYDIAIFAAMEEPPADQGDRMGDPVLQGSTTLPAGANASMVAHLTEGGEPTLSVFVNDVSPIGMAKTRILVRHTAAVGPVDLSLYRFIWRVAKLEGLANGGEDGGEIWPGRYRVTIAPEGEKDPVVGPVDLRFGPNTLYLVYAIGSLVGEGGESTFDLLIQTMDLSVDRSPHWPRRFMSVRGVR